MRPPELEGTLAETDDAFGGFHPKIAHWFRTAMGEPTPPQRAAWPLIQAGEHVLLAAPTGMGKTLAGFLASLDRLLKQRDAARLDARLDTLYIAPLRALSHDIEKNLRAPLLALNASEGGEAALPLRIAIRTGDTSPSERARAKRLAPHLLVTTPESLWILLGSESGRRLLSTTRTVILDELHALAEDKRGAHLALSLERLTALVTAAGLSEPQRLGLSATVAEAEHLARFLGGQTETGASRPVRLIDQGLSRPLDLEILVAPDPKLSAVQSEAHREAMLALILDAMRPHRSTLIFVNTRREAERLAYRLAQSFEAGAIAAYHGSLAREQRFSVLERFKAGQMKAVVATAALELGLDVGAVDLVLQIGAVSSLSGLLQRVGRAGHRFDRIPIGRLLPTTAGQLLEAVAALSALALGRLDRPRIRRAPLDVLSQHLVADLAARPRTTADLLALFRRAEPYAELPEEELQAVLAMLSTGFETARGERARWLLPAGQDGLWTARQGAGLAALLSGTAIPDNGEYAVVLDVSGEKVGKVHEDWAIESLAGDVFLLGNQTYRIARISRGEVRVQPAPGLSPSVPFWRGEARSRSPELSAAIGTLRERLLAVPPSDAAMRGSALICAKWPIAPEAMSQCLEIVRKDFQVLGHVPTASCAVVERCFDESGGIQLLFHCPLGARTLRALALLLRKRLCRSFDQELQSAATDDGFSISLGHRQSFEGEGLKALLRPEGAREDLIQAVLDAPFFETRWRHNAFASLAVQRRSGKGFRPFEILRAEADDLLAVAFPEQAACQEHRAGPVTITDHPLVRQTVKDCLEDATDCLAMEALLCELQAGRFELILLPPGPPSPAGVELLQARPYAFLDDAPLEERRARLVPREREDLVGDEPLPLVSARAVLSAEAGLPQEPTRAAAALFDRVLVRVIEGDAANEAFAAAARASGRALSLSLASGTYLLDASAEDWAYALRAEGQKAFETARGRELLTQAVRARAKDRLRLTAEDLAGELPAHPLTLLAVLRSLQAEGVLLPRPEEGAPEGFIERALLSRILSAERRRRRGEFAPLLPEQWLVWLQDRHGLKPKGTPALAAEERQEALRSAFARLAGVAIPLSDWESEILPLRVPGLQPREVERAFALGGFCLCSRTRGPALGRATRVAILEQGDGLAARFEAKGEEVALRGPAEAVLRLLQPLKTASGHVLLRGSRILPSEFVDAIRDLFAAGHLWLDSFAALRAAFGLERRVPIGRGLRRDPLLEAEFGLREPPALAGLESFELPPLEQDFFWTQSLALFGLASSDTLKALGDPRPYRSLRATLWAEEARGRIVQGRFVLGLSPEQWTTAALAQDLAQAATRPLAPRIAVSKNDPLNLAALLCEHSTAALKGP